MRDLSGLVYLVWLRNYINFIKEEKIFLGKNLLEFFFMLNVFNVRIR